MTKMKWEQFFDAALEYAYCHDLSWLWDKSKMSDQPFEDRKSLFFSLLEKTLETGRLHLKKNGHYLSGTPEEQVQLFRKAFPTSNIPDPRYPNEDASYWFYGEECPGEAVWRVEHPDGTVEWMHCP